MNNVGLNVFKQGARSAQPFEELNTGLTSMGEPSTVETQVVSGMKYKFSFDNGDQVHPWKSAFLVWTLDPLFLLGSLLEWGLSDLVFVFDVWLKLTLHPPPQQKEQGVSRCLSMSQNHLV